MRLAIRVSMAALILVAAGCGGSVGATSSPSGTTNSEQTAATSPSPSPSPSPATIAAPDGHTIAPASALPPVPTFQAPILDVTLSDALRIEPAAMTVRAGEPVIFRVSNLGVLVHEFYVGDEASQAAHEAEMVAMGGTMPHDEPNGIGLEPGETKEFTYTFPSPGEWLAGCHITNHYSGGMRATITVTD